jgi:nitroreductase
MELMEVLKSRRAVREYTGDRMERAEVDRLINAAILAPSAMNLQPWAFAAVLDPARVDAYAERAKNWLLANFSRTPFDASLRGLLENANYSLFHHAPALVLVMATASHSQAQEDCCVAAGNLLLAARDAGLGTCWIGLARPWLNLPEIKVELGLPGQYQVVAPIVLGHPTAWPASHGRNSAEIHWVE